MGKPVPVKPVDAAIRGDPEIALLVLQNGIYEVVREAFLPGIGTELSVTVSDQTSTECADPEITLPVLMQGANIVMLDCINTRLMEELEFCSIEAHQPFLSSHPQITVLSLKNNLDRVLRQTLFGAPDVVDVLADGFCRSLGGAMHTERQHGE